MSQAGAASRVPAWKRLGLKLGGDQGSPAAPTTSSIHSPSASLAVKRKASSGAPTPDHQNAAKKPRQDSQAASYDSTTPSKKAKSVSFAAETVSSGAGPATADSSGPIGKDIIRNKPKQKQLQPHVPAAKTSTTAGAATGKKPSSSSGPAPPINLGPALEYLRKWHGARDTWKFNKNHQTKLLEQVFADETTIPAADIDIFYEYIRPLKGHVRQRLRELANGVKGRDVSAAAAAFAGEGASKARLKDAEKKQAEYEAVIQSYMAKDRPAPGAKPRFQEVDYVLRTADMEMQRRVVKRMRAEVVLDELFDEGEGEASAAASSDVAGPAATTIAAEESVGTRDSLNDGSKQRIKRKRKTRTTVVEDEYDSSSSDEDDGSSDDSSDDDEAGSATQKGKAQKTAVQSADDSSSSSDSDSDSD
ncbi:WKF domain-containing protein [Microdochium nivale]|nr:WKF domain-containing protein [Microdochium nivale]